MNPIADFWRALRDSLAEVRRALTVEPPRRRVIAEPPAALVDVIARAHAGGLGVDLTDALAVEAVRFGVACFGGEGDDLTIAAGEA